MESGLTWDYSTLINELTQGLENANQLRLHLYPSVSHDLLLQSVLASYDKALFILTRGAQAAQEASFSGGIESSVSEDMSLKSQDTEKNVTDQQIERTAMSKKRKMQHTWTEQVKINPVNGLEGPTDDGYSWRKYGQKDILGAKYPRAYYRCTHRHIQNCTAQKQVQRSDVDATIFDITYKGKHTCQHSKNAVQRQAAPKNQEKKHDSQNYQQQIQNETLMNLKANLRVDTDDLENNTTPSHFLFPSSTASQDRDNYYHAASGLVDDSCQGASPFLFYPPSTSETNYLSEETYRILYQEAPSVQHSGSDIAEIISAHSSTTNSPIGSMEFPYDQLDLYPNFQFNGQAQGFYS